MLNVKTTAVPNILFDCYLKGLKGAELKVLLVIIRKTLGWADRNNYKGRKEIDWISGSQLQSLTGCSRRIISQSTEALVRKRIIDVLDEREELLSDPQLRKGKQRLFYRLSPFFTSSVDNLGKNGEYHKISYPASANFAQDLSKKVTELAQKMRITKETLQN